MQYGPLCRVLPPSSENNDPSSNSRPDNRSSWDQLRPIFLKTSVISSATGSAYFETEGGTKVFAAVHGPRPSPSSSSIDAVIHSEVKWAKFCGRTPTEWEALHSERSARVNEAIANEERELGATLTRTLTSIAMLDKYPKSKIEVSAFILEDDGGALGAVISAASLALADAGIELFDLAIGSSAAIINGEIVLDPCGKEEQNASGTVLVAYMSSVGKVCEVMQSGQLKVEELIKAVRHCCNGASQICALMRSRLEKHAKQMVEKQQITSHA